MNNFVIMKRGIIFLTALLILLFHESKAQTVFYAFAGLWKMETKDGPLYEHWTKISDSLYSGKSFRIQQTDTLVLERVQLKYVNGKPCYAPTVANQNEGKEVQFPLKEISSDGKRFVFENPEHDFPQRIIYFFSSAGKLSARVEGEMNGKIAAENYSFRKEPD